MRISIRRLPSVLGLLFIAPFLHAQDSPFVPAPPNIQVSGYILQDFHTGHLLAERNADESLPPASLTKLMTAYLAFEALEKGDIRLDDQTTVSEKAWRMKGSRMFIEVDKQVSVGDLLRGMIVQSGNDASVALAEFIAGSEAGFVGLMNRKARRLGLTQTRYANSTGMPDAAHQSTARDIARLSAALIRDFPRHYPLYAEREFTYNAIRQYNRNGLLRRDIGVDGLKTGYTEAAGYCLAGSAERKGMRLIAVVMGAQSKRAREAAVQALLDYGFRFFVTRRLRAADDALIDAKVWKAERETVKLGLVTDLTVTLPKEGEDRLTVSLDAAKRIIAPVRKGQSLGTIRVSLDERVLAERPLVALETIPIGGLWTRGMDSLRLWFK